MAREGWNLLSEVLQSFSNVWSGASTAGAINGFSGFTAGHRRWGEMFTVLWINWRVPVSFWGLGEGFWMLGKAGGGLEKKIGRWVDF